MKFATTLTLTALLAIANAATFLNLVTIKSGSEYQYKSIVDSDNSLKAGSGDGINFILNDDSSLVDRDTGKYISINKKKEVVEGSKPDRHFSISDSHLVYKGKEKFQIDRSGDKLVYGSSDAAAEGVFLSVQNEANAANVYPSKRSDDSFGVVSIASGSDLQYASIKKVNSYTANFGVGGSGNDVAFTLNDDTTLSDQDGQGIYVDPSTGEIGDVAPTGRQAATTGFSIQDGDLLLNGKNSFVACPADEGYTLTSNSECDGGVGIALKVAN